MFGCILKKEGFALC